MKKTLLFCIFYYLSSVLFAQSELDLLRQAVQKRDVQALFRLESQLNGTVLEMYPHFYRLNIGLQEATEKDIARFLTRYQDSPLALTLRIDWLKELARRKDWEEYLIEYRALSHPNIEQTCYFLQAEMAKNWTSSLRLAKPFWFSAKPQPNACNAVFDALFAKKILDEKAVWQRARQILEKGQMKFAFALLADRLPVEIVLQSKAIEQNPQKALTELNFSTKAGQELALFAIEKIARDNPAFAADIFSLYQDRLPQDVVFFAWGQIGLRGAKNLLPEALQWYRRSHPEIMSEEARIWMARLAIRESDWSLLSTAIEVMPPLMQQLPVWRYWRARALKAMHQKDAKALFEQLAKDDHGYYGLLAREEMGRSFNLVNHAPATQPKTMQTIKNLKGVRRALLLYQNGEWQSEAQREWNAAMQSLTDEELLAASRLAYQLGWYDRAIYSAEKMKSLQDYTLRFPTPSEYDKEIKAYADQHELDPAWIYGLIRQESRFMPTARSRVGALGLMQIMPTTATWIANRMSIKPFHWRSMSLPLTNIQFGTYYLQYVSKKLDDNAILATAGYNAGPNRPKRWLSHRELEGAQWIESIPFDETRDYVKKVMSNAMVYAHRMNHQSPLLKQRLGTVPTQ